MRKYLMLLFGFIFCLNAQAENKRFIELLLMQNEHISIPDGLECDTIVDINGYAVHIIKNNGKIKHIGLDLFSDEMKHLLNEDLFNYIEEALLAKSLKVNDELYDKLVISKGIISDFKSLTPESDCTVNTLNSKSMSIEWVKDNKKISVSIPIGYDISSKGNRSDIENDFISRLCSFKGSRLEFSPFDIDLLEPYGDDEFIYPGATYQSKDVTRNTYFNSKDINPVWDADLPLESMANLFIFPSDKYGDTKVSMTILKHEYGEKESLSLTLNQLLSVSENEGCVSYWGVERYENGILEGALFLYNRQKGYDHVLKIECNPIDVINDMGEIKARASLFIPTNNVQNLYSPYVKKAENDKIKYDN